MDGFANYEEVTAAPADFEMSQEHTAKFLNNTRDFRILIRKSEMEVTASHVEWQGEVKTEKIKFSSVIKIWLTPYMTPFIIMAGRYSNVKVG